MSDVNILFVDDEPRVLQAMTWLFRRLYRVHTADSALAALEILKQTRIDVIVSDQKMPGMNGTSLLRECARLSPRTIRLLLTGYSDINDAISAVNSGEVFRYIRKPWDNEMIRETVAAGVNAALAIRDEADAEPEDEAVLERVEEAAGVLVLDHDGLFDMVAASLRPSYLSYRAADINQALDLLNMHHIGVVVIEHSPAYPMNIDFVKALKFFKPEINSIVLTPHADIDEVIDLINMGRVYRFGMLPAKASMLRLSIDSGLRHHARLLLNPKLHKSQAIDKASLLQHLRQAQTNVTGTANSRSGQAWAGIIAKLKGLRKFTAYETA